ncbi:MAG: protein kinase [Bacteroidota bacterium]
MIGQTIGNYRVLEMIGEGGMGTVYVGEHLRLERKVAIKALHPHFTRQENLRQRFKNEATTLSKLQHPGIVTLHDYIEEGDDLYLILEYVKGRDLGDLVQNEYGPLPKDLLQNVFVQMLGAIGYAHDQGIIHRDIKPSNFILNEAGKVKVLDFGIAKIFGDGEKNLTKTGTRMGTVYYMSPEQVHGKKLDKRSDIYSLGVTLFNLATGKLPFDRDTSEFDIQTQILSQPLPVASSIYPGVTSGVDRLIHFATQKDPDLRFQSCADFRTGNAPGHPMPTAKPAPKKPPAAAPAKSQDRKTVVDIGPYAGSTPQKSGATADPIANPSGNSPGPRVWAQPIHSLAEFRSVRIYINVALVINLIFLLLSVLPFIANRYMSDSELSSQLIGNVLTTLVFVGSLGMKMRHTWGLNISKVVLIIYLIFTCIGSIGLLVILADLPAYVEPAPVVISLAIIAAYLGYLIWGIRVCFSRKATRYFAIGQ